MAKSPSSDDLNLAVDWLCIYEGDPDELAALKREEPKIRRPARTYCIHQKSDDEFRVLNGNRIVSRHRTQAEAQEALRQIFSGYARGQP